RVAGNDARQREPVSVAVSRFGQGIRFVGAKVVDGVGEVGRVTLMYRDVAKSLGRLPHARLVVDQMDRIGVGSLGLVVVISLFTGAVAAVQAAYQFSSVVPMRYL